VLALRIGVAHELGNGRGVSNARAFGQDGHEALGHQLAEFGSVLHGGCGGCMFVKNLIAPVMAQPDLSQLSDTEKIDLLLRLALSNQAFLRTLLGREAVRISEQHNMTVDDATAFLHEEFKAFKQEHAEAYGLTLTSEEPDSEEKADV
jgi:hypothetical protein